MFQILVKINDILYKVVRKAIIYAYMAYCLDFIDKLQQNIQNRDIFELQELVLLVK